MRSNFTYVKLKLLSFCVVFLSAPFIFNSSLKAQILFQSSFEGSNPFQGTSTSQACCSYSITASTLHPHDGAQSYRAEVKQNDPAVSSGYRAELTFPGIADQGDMWYGYSMYFQGNNSTGTQWTGVYGHVTQWHPGNSYGSASLCMYADNGVFDITVNPTGDRGGINQTGNLQTIEANRWYDIVWHVVWGNNGKVEVWIDGNLYFTKTGLNWAGGEYFKFGMNRWLMSNDWVIFYDNLKIGRNVTYNDVAPSAAVAPGNQSPVANAGNNITLTLPTNSTTLNGSATDADGTITSYSWSRVSGPTTYTMANPNAASTALTNLVQGTYVFRLTVTDDSSATGTDDVTVTVNPPPNQPPTANAGNDITLTLPTNSTTLNGSGSDPDGSITGYQWSRVSGPTTYTMANPNAASTALTNLVQGTYVFRLRVTDDDGATGTDNITVIVNAAPANQPPTANAGNNITLTLPTNSTTLNGSGTDPNGTVTGYAWSRISGPTAYTIASPNAASTALTNLVQGTYVFRLTVTDNNNATGTDDVTVTVNAAPNQSPTANAGNNIVLTLPTNSTTLNGGGNDPDGTIAGYTWTKISGPNAYALANANAASTLLSNLVQGTYVFRLTVTDNSNATGTDDVTVTVNPAPNQPPTASAGNDIVLTLPTNSTTLNGSGTDPNGTVTGYSWSRVSGPTTYTLENPNTASTGLSNLVQGVYVFRLTVTDNNNATGTDDVTVTVNAAPNQPPTASAGNDIVLTLPTNSTTLNGIGTDPNGTITSYAWSKISGPNTYALANANVASTGLSNLVQGVYVFRLTVTDNNGATGTDDITVTVNAAPNQPPTANAGNDIVITLPTSSATLNGSGADSDGTITGYAWSVVSKPASSPAPVFSNASAASTGVSALTVAGAYVFKLTVTDNKGATASDNVTVTVNLGPNQLPTANAGNDIELTLPVNYTTLSGSGSTDPDGTIAAYKWHQVSGPTQALITDTAASGTEVSDLMVGVYVFELKVTDNRGGTSIAKVKVTVRNKNGDAVYVNVYPNPATDKITIQYMGNIKGEVKITLLDINKRIVLSESATKDQVTLTKEIDISHLSNGAYIIQTILPGNLQVAKKLIKQQ